MSDTFDLVILGSGSTAFAAALAAQELGKTAVMTEERTLSTCSMFTRRWPRPSRSLRSRALRTPRNCPAVPSEQA
jgi:hypothetical protein